MLTLLKKKLKKKLINDSETLNSIFFFFLKYIYQNLQLSSENIAKKFKKFQINLQNLVFRQLVTTQIRRTSLHLKTNNFLTILQRFGNNFAAISTILQRSLTILRRFSMVLR